MKINKPRILFITPLPPPVHGSAVVSQYIKDCKELQEEFVCDFVGGESKEITRDVFEKAVEERGLKKYAIYHGPKYGDDKVAFFSNADIFVQPTLNDCFPLTLLEAMQYQLPIVSTHEGAVPDIVKDGKNGFICEREDAIGTATAIETLLNDKEKRTQMGDAGYKIFKKRFTLNIFNENITNVLKGIVQ